LPFEQIVVQTAHAGMEMIRRGFLPTHLDHPNLVVVGIDHEDKLHRTLHKIKQSGVECIPFIEPDRNDELTAFATEPIQGERRHLFRRYNCLRVPFL
jgi:hypothetical protein